MIEATGYSEMRKFNHEETGQSRREWVPGCMVRDDRAFSMSPEPHARIVCLPEVAADGLGCVPPWLVTIGGVSTCWMRYWTAQKAFKAASRAVRYGYTLGRKQHEDSMDS